MRSLKKKTAVIGLAVLSTILFAAESCEGEDSGQVKEDKARQSNYDRLSSTQPSGSMDYSPTRETKNGWIRTWGQRGKVSYVYLLNSDMEAKGYFVLKGLPVSYCTSLIPPYQIKDFNSSSGGNALAVPGPSIDGTFSSGSDCNTKYGFDAVTGSYVEYTVGMGLNQLIFDQPMPQYGDAEPLGEGTIAEAKKQ